MKQNFSYFVRKEEGEIGGQDTVLHVTQHLQKNYYLIAEVAPWEGE